MRLPASHQLESSQKVTFGVFCIALASILNLNGETVLMGDYNLEDGNLYISEGSLMVGQGGITSDGDMTVRGNFDSPLGIYFGRTTGNLWASYQGYIPTDKTVVTFATEQDVSFLWKEGFTAIAKSKMSLGATNILSLFKSGGTVGMTLDPNNGKITLPLGSQSGIYNSSGNPVMQIGTSGVVSFAQSLQVAGQLHVLDEITAGGQIVATEATATSIAASEINSKLNSTGPLRFTSGSAYGFSATAMSAGEAIMDYSVGMAFGYANGYGAVAMADSYAEGSCSTAMSGATAFGMFDTALSGGIADGGSSTAMSAGTTASSYSVAAGLGVIAYAANEIAIGRYNTTTAPGSPVNWVDNQNLLSVGNGVSTTQRSNAITVLKNGRTTIKNKSWSSSAPTAIPGSSIASAGDALIVEGHVNLKGNTVMGGNTVLKGKVTMEQPQGDISMGIFE